MKFSEWFDVYNIEHIIAINEMMNKTGMWPKGFLPKDIEIESNWFIILMSKMLNA